MRLKVLFFVLAITAGLAGYFFWQQQAVSSKAYEETISEIEPVVVSNRQESLVIQDNDTFGKLMEKAGIDSSLAQDIFTSASELYDLSNIRVGREIVLWYDSLTDKLSELAYQIDSEEELRVSWQEDQGWLAERLPIPYEVRVKTVRGEIENFLYADALAQGVDERAVIAWAEMFQWTLDFSMDIRQGDEYIFIYEERYLADQYIMPGRVLAGKFVNNDTVYYGFYFEENEENKGYFDKDGNSLQKMFLKAPVAFKYISSGFTTGARYIQAFNISTGHRAIDYAASFGTPVRSVGDGTVVLAGWDGSYGNKVSVRHNGTYTTNYAHLSKISVQSGQKVSQGQTIGLVGSTGLSTGPHLHYEMVKHGAKINPLREVLPPGEPIALENMPRFQEVLDKFLPLLE